MNLSHTLHLHKNDTISIALTNAVRNKLNLSERTDEDIKRDKELCQPNTCPMDSGCMVIKGQIRCFCVTDMSPLDMEKGCPQPDQSKIVRHDGHADPDQDSSTPIHPTDGSIEPMDRFEDNIYQESPLAFNGSHQFDKHLSKSPNHLSHRHQQQHQSYIMWNNLIIPAIIVSVSLVTIVILIVYAKRSGLLSGRRSKRKISPDASKGSLARCIQQYVINPNYYSSSPNASLKKILQDIEISAERVTLMEEIGEGCFGRVYKGEYRPNDEEVIQVAVKVLKDDVSSEVGNSFDREVEILSNFKHPNIVKLIGVINKESRPSMVFEYMALGDLTEILRRMDPKFKKQAVSSEPHVSSESSIQMKFLTEDDLIWIATQIADGMMYLSSQHFVHRDLATRNCLVTHNLTVKISDFGLSRDIYTCDYYKVNGHKMLPIRWMSPESIIYGKYTLESDVWSFGVVLWEIFAFGKQPYYGHSNDEVVKLILQGILLIPPEDCPEFICKLMAGCWKTEPKDRLNFETIWQKLMENCSEERQELINNLIEVPKDCNEEVISVENYMIPIGFSEMV